jgi:hypothetical protein
MFTSKIGLYVAYLLFNIVKYKGSVTNNCGF